MKATTIDISGDRPKGLGEKEYQERPMQGDWIEIEDDGVATMFEVVKIAHSSSGNGCDIYVRRVGKTSDAIHSLGSHL